MMLRAEGGYVEEEQAIKIKTKGGGEDVKVVTVKKYIAPDTQAGIYFLNNRARDHWKTYKAHEHTGPMGGPIQHNHTSQDVLDAVQRITEALK